MTLPPDRLGASLRGDLIHLDGRVVYSLDGELDVAGADHFRSRLASLVDEASDGAVVLDVSALTFMDSTGLTALLAVRERAAGRGRSVRLLGASPAIRRLLTLTCVDELFELPG